MLLGDSHAGAVSWPLEFIRWLANETCKVRLIWNEQPHTLTPTLDSGLVVQFLTSHSHGEEAWRLLTRLIHEMEDATCERRWELAANPDPAES